MLVDFYFWHFKQEKAKPIDFNKMIFPNEQVADINLSFNGLDQWLKFWKLQFIVLFEVKNLAHKKKLDFLFPRFSSHNAWSILIRFSLNENNKRVAELNFSSFLHSLSLQQVRIFSKRSSIFFFKLQIRRKKMKKLNRNDETASTSSIKKVTTREG